MGIGSTSYPLLFSTKTDYLFKFWPVSKQTQELKSGLHWHQKVMFPNFYCHYNYIPPTNILMHTNVGYVYFVFLPENSVMVVTSIRANYSESLLAVQNLSFTGDIH